MEFAAFTKLVNIAIVKNKRLRFINCIKQKVGIANTRTCYSYKKLEHIIQNCLNKLSSSNISNSSNSG